MASTHHMIFLIFKHIIVLYSVAIERKESRMVLIAIGLGIGMLSHLDVLRGKEKTKWLRAFVAPMRT